MSKEKKTDETQVQESAETKRYLELQMAELKEALGVEIDEITPKKPQNYRTAQHAEMAKLYEDAAEYEEDLKGFEEELEVINATEIKALGTALMQAFPKKEKDYTQELKLILEAAWTHFVDVEKTHPQEELQLIKETAFCDIVEKFNSTYPTYSGNFEKEIKAILVQRWQMLISIKKEHIKEEFTNIKTLGLKPNYAKRMYKQYHGIE